MREWPQRGSSWRLTIAFSRAVRRRLELRVRPRCLAVPAPLDLFEQCSLHKVQPPRVPAERLNAKPIDLACLPPYG